MSRRPLYLPKGIRVLASFNNTAGFGVAISIKYPFAQLDLVALSLAPQALRLKPLLLHSLSVTPTTFYFVFPGTFTRRVFYPPVVWRTGGLARLGRGLPASGMVY
jgi:hypothetical protein